LRLAPALPGVFDEVSENVENREKMLLQIDIEGDDPQALHVDFCGAHSVKGGAATFGFGEAAELTHLMETLRDKPAATRARSTWQQARWWTCASPKAWSSFAPRSTDWA
jgi:chemotaxis protein histidine kinase CheA